MSLSEPLLEEIVEFLPPHVRQYFAQENAGLASVVKRLAAAESNNVPPISPLRRSLFDDIVHLYGTHPVGAVNRFGNGIRMPRYARARSQLLRRLPAVAIEVGIQAVAKEQKPKNGRWHTCTWIDTNIMQSTGSVADSEMTMALYNDYFNTESHPAECLPRLSICDADACARMASDDVEMLLLRRRKVRSVIRVRCRIRTSANSTREILSAFDAKTPAFYTDVVYNIAPRENVRDHWVITRETYKRNDDDIPRSDYDATMFDADIDDYDSSICGDEDTSYNTFDVERHTIAADYVPGDS